MEFFKKIFYHPILSVIFGVGGIALAVYFGLVSIKKPNLTYYISPTRTAIVQKGNLNNFSVTYQGTQVTGDLSSAEIQIWNQGKQPIRREDILKTITLKTPNNEPIYQSTLKTTRDVEGVSFTTSSGSPVGVLGLDWKILEHNDGIKLQIIYGGSVNLPLTLDGVIEGQQQGITKYLGAKSDPSTMVLIVIVLGGLTITFGSILIKKQRGERDLIVKVGNVTTKLNLPHDRSFQWFIYLNFVLMSIAWFCVLILLIKDYLIRIKPPFGF